MIQAGDCEGLPLEALARLGLRVQPWRENLNGNHAVKAQVAGLIDLPHTTCTDRRRNQVRTEFRAGLNAHGNSLYDTQFLFE